MLCEILEISLKSTVQIHTPPHQITVSMKGHSGFPLQLMK